MRVKVYVSQSTVIFDTLNRKDPALVVLQAQEATAVFLSQDRADLDGNVGAGGPRGGFFLNNALPPMTLLGPKCVLWGRANADTEIEVQVFEQRTEVTAVPASAKHQPVARPPVKTFTAGWGGSIFKGGREL